MDVTRLGEKGDRCRVWNKRGLPVESPETFDCKQEQLARGYRKGGNGTGVDVDAFTFNGENYRFRFAPAFLWEEQKKGVWTKFPDGFVATCTRGVRNRIECTVRPFLPEDASFPVPPVPPTATPGSPTTPAPSARLEPAPSARLEPTPSSRLDPAPSSRLDPAPSAGVEPTPPQELGTSGVRQWILGNAIPMGLLAIALLLLWLGGGRGDNAGVMRRLGGVVVALALIGLALGGAGVNIGSWLANLLIE